MTSRSFGASSEIPVRTTACTQRRDVTVPGSVEAPATSSLGTSALDAPTEPSPSPEIASSDAASRIGLRPSARRRSIARWRAIDSSHVSSEPALASNWDARRHNAMNVSWTTSDAASRSPRKRTSEPKR
jgi:hypothetical protein